MNFKSIIIRITDYRELRLLKKLIKTVKILNSATQYAVFCDFSGHTNQIHVRIMESKKEYTKEFYNLLYYLDNKKESIKKTREVINHLSGFLKNS